MLVPVSWLSQYVDIDIAPTELAERMILSGSNIETVETFGEGISGVVIGKITSITKHGDSDHLLICQVEVGAAAAAIGFENPIQIVTGAQNVFEGAIVPVALHGAKLSDGLKIKKGKLRGEVSNGMLCSAAELGFDDKVIPFVSKDGIWILNEDEFADKIGQDALDALELRDTIIDFEITPNRPDCLSIIGMARETAATLGKEISYPEVSLKEESTAGQTDDILKIDINKPELCRRYVGRIASDITIAQSPWWLQRRLMLTGMRPINNIVDITNYVLLELGHPIHAFDIRQIADQHIIVDTAAKDEHFTTLDSQDRILDEDVLLIKDSQKGVAIAGVMGGENSEVLDDTQTIIVEAANFNEDSIRKTSKKLGIRTEASARYEKGVDANLCAYANDRVCALIEEIGAGKVLSGRVDHYPTRVIAPEIIARVARVNAVLGTQIPASEMVTILESLEIEATLSENKQEILAIPQTFRGDLKEEVDIIEEVGRIYGYENLGMTLHKDHVTVSVSKSWQVRGTLRNLLTDLGLSESTTYSFVSPSTVDRVRIPADDIRRSMVRLINPLGEENSVMRTVLLPNTLEVLERNYKRGIAEAHFFEIGNTFIDLHDKLPKEEQHLSLGLYGGDIDFFGLKGIVLQVLTALGVDDVAFVQVTDDSTYHPGRCAKLVLGDTVIGTIGELHPDVAESYGISGSGVRVYAGELSVDILTQLSDTFHMYQPLPKYPSTSRDISLLVDEDVSVADVESIIKANGGQILEDVALFDIYRGTQIGEGKKSMSFSLTYRSSEGTLTDEDVAKVHENILKIIEEKTGATLREI
ncbi:MAG: phenylalanine--tRNA ligase subunit beta [Clostridiales Family XIII bacterium]|jgi:phenylalanyl-tRNA synthetase beta chain|nr:phenylalanine--tRNA ligase subunit beta [Clostridiales Family XIII bacterium]